MKHLVLLFLAGCACLNPWAPAPVPGNVMYHHPRPPDYAQGIADALAMCLCRPSTKDSPTAARACDCTSRLACIGHGLKPDCVWDKWPTVIVGCGYYPVVAAGRCEEETP